MILSRVVLPQPEAPTIETNSPGPIRSDVLSSSQGSSAAYRNDRLLICSKPGPQAFLFAPPVVSLPQGNQPLDQRADALNEDALVGHEREQHAERKYVVHDLARAEEDDDDVLEPEKQAIGRLEGNSQSAYPYAAVQYIGISVLPERMAIRFAAE
jgi:hypothetical protein